MALNQFGEKGEIWIYFFLHLTQLLLKPIPFLKKHWSKKLTNSTSKAKVATFAFSLHETNCLVRKELARNLVRLLFLKTRNIKKKIGELHLTLITVALDDQNTSEFSCGTNA